MNNLLKFYTEELPINLAAINECLYAQEHLAKQLPAPIRRLLKNKNLPDNPESILALAQSPSKSPDLNMCELVVDLIEALNMFSQLTEELRKSQVLYCGTVHGYSNALRCDIAEFQKARTLAMAAATEATSPSESEAR